MVALWLADGPAAIFCQGAGRGAPSAATSHADHVTGEGRPQARYRSFSFITSLRPRPGLRFLEQLAELLEQHLGQHAFGSESLDADESLENGLRLLHRATVARERSPMGERSVANPCQTAVRSATCRSSPRS